MVAIGNCPDVSPGICVNRATGLAFDVLAPETVIGDHRFKGFLACRLYAYNRYLFFALHQMY
jgi:hypothetical protein